MSASARRLNAHLFPGGGVALTVGAAAAASAGKRLRQSAAVMNKLEEQVAAYLAAQYPAARIHAQAKRYRLGNGVWYKPDFTALIGGVEHAWEAKGPKAFRGGFENLKVASGLYPEIKFTLIWRDAGAWRVQEILA